MADPEMHAKVLQYLTVPCPFCRVRAGERCVPVAAIEHHNKPYIHSSRIAAWAGRDDAHLP